MAEPEIASYGLWKPNTGQDPAKYLVNPGTVTGPGKHSAGQLRNARPYFTNGSKLFVFPVGVEGFRRSGQATLGLHRYIGGNSTDGITINYEEGRIELTGTFPGITAQDNMVNCINILRSSGEGLTLYAPGVFEREQYVLAENWDFSHDPDDRSHSIAYTISLVRIGEGKTVKSIPGKAAPPQPTVGAKPKGKPSRIFTTRDGVRTFRAVAKVVYKNENQWTKLVSLNQGELNAWKKKHSEIPSHQLPTFRWPIGTKFRY